MSDDVEYSLTANYQLKKPFPGLDDDIWGGHVNENSDLIDNLIFTNLQALQGVFIRRTGDTLTEGGTISGVPTPTASDQVAPKFYVDGAVAALGTASGNAYLAKTGGALTSGTISNIPTPVAASEAAPKSYVDAFVSTAVKVVGSWNASTNTPTLASGNGTPVGSLVGNGFIVDTPGATVIDGAGPWFVGDLIIWNASNKWTRVPYGSVYAMANNGTLTGPTITGATQLGLVGGDTLMPLSTLTAYKYSVYWVDSAKRIAAGILLDGTLEVSELAVAHINAADVDGATGTIGDLTSTTLRYTTHSLEPVPTDSFLMLYNYQYVVSDAAKRWAMGFRPNGRYDFASLYAAELVTATRSITAAGTDQATATQVACGITTIAGGVAGAGVVLVPALGGFWYLENTTANAVLVYPSAGASFGALSANAPITLDPAATKTLWQSTATRYAAAAGGGGGGGSDVFVGTGFLTPRDIHDRVADTVNVYDLVTGLDPTGVADNSTLIRQAHDAAAARGYRYLYFPKGSYNAPTLDKCGNVIFVGSGNASLVGTYRKRIFARHLGAGTPPSDVSPEFQWPRYKAAALAATLADPVKICVLGDSTTTQALSGPGCGDGLGPQLWRRFAEALGPKPFKLVELGIGGAAWPNLASATPFAGPTYPVWYTDTGQTWMYYVGLYGPWDLVIFNFGQNDNDHIDPVAMNSAISQVQALSPNADFAFITPYVPSTQYAGTTKATLEGREYAGGYERTFARRTGAGLIDFGRWADVVRDGFDPCEGAMHQLTLGSMTLPYTWPQETSDFAARITFASMANMWNSGKLQFQLSSNAANLLILEKDTASGCLAYTVQTQAGTNSVPRTVTTFNVTGAGGNQLKIQCKGAHIYVLFNNIEVVNLLADRFGGVYLPKIFWDAGAGVSPSSPTISYFTPNLYMPQITDIEAFGPDGGTTETNGNGFNHITTLAQAQYWAPVLDVTRFA